MGRVAVDRLAEMGAKICLLGRDPTKTQAVADELRKPPRVAAVDPVQCDLSLLSQVRDAAQQVLHRYDRIDLLINCAGINVPERRLSSEGYELNFVVNYLASFLLTELLADRIKSTPSARIVNLSSATQEVAKLDLDDLQGEKKWSLLSSYAQAKLCLIMHSRDLAKRLKDTSATINCLNPGNIRSNIGRGHTKASSRLMMRAFVRMADPTWVSGERIVAAALDEQYQGVSGKFIYEDFVMQPNPLALDEANIARLMEVSRQLTGLKLPD